LPPSLPSCCLGLVISKFINTSTRGSAGNEKSEIASYISLSNNRLIVKLQMVSEELLNNMVGGKGKGRLIEEVQLIKV
jgi:tRNA U34 5-carboxymethylaminomethyl modifying enzyme MnmG/GidA